MTLVVKTVLVDDFVVGGALAGLETRAQDQAPHLVEFHIIVEPRGGHHVFLEHDRPEIIGPEGQPQLPHLLAGRHPRRLKVGQAGVQHQTGDRKGAQVRLAPGGRQVQRLMAALVHPGDETQKALRFLLQFFHEKKMLDALLHRLKVPEHHGGRGLHPQAVQGRHDAQPFGSRGLARRGRLRTRWRISRLPRRAWNPSPPPGT